MSAAPKKERMSLIDLPHDTPLELGPTGLRQGHVMRLTLVIPLSTGSRCFINFMELTVTVDSCRGKSRVHKIYESKYIGSGFMASCL